MYEIFDRGAAEAEKRRRIRNAVKELIDACGENCYGCPIVYLCEKEFKDEPWKWGIHGEKKGVKL